MKDVFMFNALNAMSFTLCINFQLYPLIYIIITTFTFILLLLRTSQIVFIIIIVIIILIITIICHQVLSVYVRKI